MSTPTNTQVFKLSYPFTFRGTEYTEFNARRPKVRDLRQFIKDLDSDSVKAMEKVLSSLCDVDDPVIAELDIEDFQPMKAWFERFLKPMLDASNES